MGYYTSHRFDVLDVTAEKKLKLIDLLREEEEYFRYAINDKGGTYDSCKWYEHEDDLRRISKKHPDLVLVLEGDGEEAGDIWKEYYRNGKMQRCKAKITFDEFDESQLK